MAGASTLVTGNEARRVMNAASDLVLVTPAGGMKLRDLQEPELEWLRLSKGKSGNLSTGRKALKVMAGIRELGEDLARAGHGAAAAEAATPPARDLALVPYTPRRVVRPHSGDGEAGAPRLGFSAVVETAPRAEWYWEYSKAVGMTMFELWGPWVAVALWVMRRLPGLVFLVVSVYTTFMVGYLVAHPELVVKGLFALLDLVPQYASYATGQIAQQFQIELAARLR